MHLLEVAKQLAHNKHANQVDQAGAPYILHIQRVVAGVQSNDAKIVAWLHDILEDTDTSISDLKALTFPMYIIDAVLALTKQPSESRLDAALRTQQNRLATEVKLADLADNMDLSRLSQITHKDLMRYQEYQHVQALLMKMQKKDAN